MPPQGAELHGNKLKLRRAVQETREPRVIDEDCAHAARWSPMTSADYARDRRSSRIFRRMRILAKGKNREGRRFREACETIVINAHGGLLYASEPVEMGALLTITNPATQDEQECRIVYLGEDTGKGRRVGIEFVTPSPHFWGIEFAQPDWSSRPSQPASQQQT